MTSFPIIDVALGLIFTYLTLSLVITASNELLASVLSRRQKTLLVGIKNLLGDQMRDALYAHPLIRSLSNDGKHPSYIPSRTFALALLDVIEPAIAALPPPSPHTTDPRVPALQARLEPDAKAPASSDPNAPPLLPAALRRQFRVLLAEGQHDVELFKVQLEEWFNNGMERVSGWYKRETQFILFVLAIVLTVSVNADTLKIVTTLWRDPTVRTETAMQAQAYLNQLNQKPATSGAPDPPDEVQAATKKLADAMNQLNSTNLPLGWDKPCTQDAPCRSGSQMWPGLSGQAWSAALGDHVLGWLMTALAISLGAPFWFDTLNRVMSIRGAGKSPEEQPKQPKSVPQPREPGEVP